MHDQVSGCTNWGLKPILPVVFRVLSASEIRESFDRQEVSSPQPDFYPLLFAVILFLTPAREGEDGDTSPYPSCQQ